MQIKKFEGTDMQEVLRLVKRELGPNAVILSTRHIKKGNGSYGMFGRSLVEVTAAIDESGETVPAVTREARPASRAEPLPTVHNINEMIRVLEPFQQDLLDIKNLIRQWVTKERTAPQINSSGLEREFTTVRKMVESLVRGQQDNKNPLFPAQFMPLYQRLLASGVGEELARNLIEKIQNSIDKEKVTQEPYVRNYIAGTLVKLVPVSGPLRLQAGKAAVAAFVGATGVGKTTTIAKLAAHYALGEKKRVALVTIDTYRIAAIEQLRTFANIIGLPIDVVLTESELDTILAKHEKMDLVLIDTAGRSQRDQLQMAELASCFGNRKRAEVHLVLSATSSSQNLTETLERFSPLGLDSLIFTKLDESNIYGSILSSTLLSQLPLSYLTTGQQVPEDIEVATPERIVDLILNVSQWRELEIA